MRTFAIGDIHGAHLALEQCLARSGFNRNADQLVTLGDICDGWPYVFECVEILLTVVNRIDIIGNHDEWFKRWLTCGVHPDAWIQGGNGTYRSYSRNLHGYDDSHHYLNSGDIPGQHWKFFMHQRLYFEENNHFFVHGGFDRYKSIDDNRTDNPTAFYWDRDLWDQALSCKGEQKLQTVDDFDKIYIGHTATTHWTEKEVITIGGIIIPRGGKIMRPMFSGGVWNLDTGAGWTGKLTIMDVDTNEYWQSDLVTDLYPEEYRNR